MTLTAPEHLAGPLLAVCAHPDDIEIHAGGLAALLSRAGVSVTFALVTSGDRGTSDAARTLEEVARVREDEQRRAAAELGVTDVRFLGFLDGDVQYETRRLRERLVRLIRELRPRTIVTHAPFGEARNADACSVYPDHRAVGVTAFESAYVAAPGPLYHPEHIVEGLAPHKPDRLLCVMSDRPNTFVDISEVFPVKWRAIREHRSQGRHLEGMEQFFHDIAAAQGVLAGCALAEGYWELLPT